MKKVGIITMHRVVNYGSALQAWATQEILQCLGYDVEIIDYVYPNKRHKKRNVVGLVKRIPQYLLHLYQGFPQERKARCHETFWKENYNLSKTYATPEAIFTDPPQYDVYIAGSDQIWNPKHTKGDSVFLLDFVKQGVRISFASSFAQADLPKEYEGIYAKCLNKFSSISVRENNGAEIIKRLLGKDVPVCLDPTLLLTKKDYEKIASQSSLEIKEPYILVYILQYMYNPYPYATKFIQETYKQTGLKVVCLDFSAKQRLNVRNSINLHDSVGPAEFIYLLSNASMVITTSFHGTAFALNFGIPVYSIISDKSVSDDRMKSLLTCCGMPERAIPMNTENIEVSLDNNDNGVIQYNLEQLRKKTLDYLKCSLTNNGE